MLTPMRRMRLTIAALVTVAVLTSATFGCASRELSPTITSAGTTPNTPTPPPGTVPSIQVVVFTHIEDNTPGGVLSDATTRRQYTNLRARLLDMARLMRSYSAKWSVEPDWKFLLAALQYEDAALRTSTGNVNVLRYLHDSLGVAIDAHSHEGSGYNYSDVAHLLDSLGVGGSTVIGGHIWDPSLPQFQQWDRFRVPVRGQHYPSAFWRGEILMGSGTPNHVNDPTVSGVWRPVNKDRYFEDDPAGNIAAIGAWRSDIAGISELFARYTSGQTPTTCILTTSMHVSAATLTPANGIAAIEASIIKPLMVLRDSSKVQITDFTTLVSTWRSTFGAKACIYRVMTQ